MKKLFMIGLGGSIKNANVEVHAMQFMIADKIEDKDMRDYEIKQINYLINKTKFDESINKAIVIRDENRYENTINLLKDTLVQAEKFHANDSDNKQIIEIKNTINQTYMIQTRLLIEQGKKLKDDNILEEALNSYQEALKITDKFGGIDKNKAKELDYEVLPGDAWIEQEVDILIPAALENQITAENVTKISKKVKVISEGANGPTTPEADKVIHERGIFMIPDFLANAGGVTCSYFEQVQSNMNYFWEKEETLSKLDLKMTSAFIAVGNFAKKNNLTMRDAAYVISINRVIQASRDRGWV